MADESRHGGTAPERFEPEAFAGLPSGYALRPLPVGRHGLTRSQVFLNQRMRLVGAMLEVLPRYGYPGVTITHLAQEARVSRAAFYEQFQDKEECFLATYDLAAAWLCERVERATESDTTWSRRVRAGIEVTLVLFAANPSLAHLFAIDVYQAGLAARDRQSSCLGRFAKGLRGGRDKQPALPEELEEMLLGGVLATIARYVESGRVDGLSGAVDELSQYMLIPYIGIDEASRLSREVA